MKARKCSRCSRRRPLRKLRPWATGEIRLCSDDRLCWLGHHRDEAKVIRWILGDHDWAMQSIETGLTKSGWRENLWYRRMRSRGFDVPRPSWWLGVTP